MGSIGFLWIANANDRELEMLTKHYVEFYTPGVIVSEADRREVLRWDVQLAAELMRAIGRGSRQPYGFRFITIGREDSEFSPREVARGPMYFLPGRVRSYEDIAAEKLASNEILLFNMRTNGWRWMIDWPSMSSWCAPLLDGDRVLSDSRP